MAFFSFAYRDLSTGTGALLLFVFVQMTMFGVALLSGDRFPALAWAGLAIALGGIVYLLAPGITAPDPFSAVLMAISGISWGIYSLLGAKAQDPTVATANNFIFATPFAFLVSATGYVDASISLKGLLLAIASGAVASGLGYAIWYRAIRNLRATTAASVQLTVPALATVGGIVFLNEPLSGRTIVSVSLTIVGIGIVLLMREKAVK